jgi:RES domain-containing protein
VQIGGRFTPKGGFPTIYLASDLPAAYGEVEGVLAAPGIPVRFAAHPPLLFVAVEGLLADVLDLTDTDVQASLNTSHQELTGDWRYLQFGDRLAPTQQLGKIAYESGRFVAVLAPSAKHPASQIVAVFFDRLVPAGGSRLQVLDPHRFFSQRLP